jgi:hypothetical protein
MEWVLSPRKAMKKRVVVGDLATVQPTRPIVRERCLLKSLNGFCNNRDLNRKCSGLGLQTVPLRSLLGFKHKKQLQL